MTWFICGLIAMAMADENRIASLSRWHWIRWFLCCVLLGPAALGLEIRFIVEDLKR